jgi:hypothetical protein
MKQVTAFFLAIIYLGFTTGAVWTMSHPGKYAFEKAVVEGNADESAFNQYTKGIQLTKAHQHLAAIAKIKIPRQASTPVASAGLVCYKSVNKITQKLNLTTALLPQTSLFLKNCVFLI